MEIIKKRKLLGEILVEKGIITSQQLKKALEVQQAEGGLIGETLVKLGFATEEDIAHCLSFQCGFPFLPLDNYDIPTDVLKLVPYEFAIQHRLIPVDKMAGTLIVCMVDPLNKEVIEKLKDMTSLNIRVFVSTPADIKGAINKYYCSI